MIKPLFFKNRNLLKKTFFFENQELTAWDLVLRKYFIFQARDVKVTPVDFNAEFIAKIIPKVEWSALFKAAESVSI